MTKTRCSLSLPATAIAIAIALAAAVNAADPVNIELAPCRIDAGFALPTAKAKCGELIRPENPDAPDGKKISLRVAVVPALAVETQPDPLVFFAGGPGQGAVESYLSMRGAFEVIRQKRDIILVDQRGTGESNRLQCPLPEEPDGITELDLDAAREDAKQCIDELPGDPRFYTTSVAVDDIDAVRKALGIEQLNLWGGSYGSRVAQHYLRKYPQHTRTTIIDGVIAPEQLLGPELAIAAQDSLEDLFNRCAEDAACKDRFGDLSATFDELATRLEQEPVTVEIASPRSGEMRTLTIGRFELSSAMRLSSYQPMIRALLPLMIRNASDGDFRLLASNVAMVNDTFTDLLAMGMHNAIVCSEDAPLFRDEPDLIAKLDATYIGDVQYEYLKATCDVWPQGTVDDGFHDPLVTDKPVLLLSGEFDPVTPPENAEKAAAGLSNAAHIVAPQQGHIISGLGCMPYVLGDFVETADPKTLDASCVERLRGMPFFVTNTGPSP